MKNHVPTFDDFANESLNESTDYKTKSIVYHKLDYSDFVADGPEVDEVSMVILVGMGGMRLVRIWSKDPKKKPVGEEFFVKVPSTDPKVIQVLPSREFLKELQPGIQDYVKSSK